MEKIRERDVSIPCCPDQRRQPTQNDGGSPRCATGINNGVRTPCKGTDHLPVANTGDHNRHTHTLRTHIHRDKNKKMSGSKDQGTSYFVVPFDLEFLEHLTDCSTFSG